MKKYKSLSLVVVFVLLVFLFLASSTDLIIKEKETKVYSVSVLVDLQDDVGFGNFKAGLDSCSRVRHIDMSFITLYDDKKPNQQMELLNRELEDGVDGIVLLSQDKNLLSEMLETVDVSVPVAVYGAVTENPQPLVYFTENREKVAAMITEEILKNETEKRHIMVLNDDTPKVFETQLVDLIKEKLEPQGFSFGSCYLSDNGELFNEEGRPISLRGDIVIAPSAYLLNKIIVKNLPSDMDVSIYGVGWSGTVRRAIDENKIKGSVAFNEYDVGYLAIDNIAGKLDDRKYKRPEEHVQEVDCIWVNKDSIYLKENLHMLFPMT